MDFLSKFQITNSLPTGRQANPKQAPDFNYPMTAPHLSPLPPGERVGMRGG